MVIRKEPIEDTVNPKGISQDDNVNEVETYSHHKTHWTFRDKWYYEGDTNGKNSFTDDSQTVKGNYVKKWRKTGKWRRQILQRIFWCD